MAAAEKNVVRGSHGEFQQAQERGAVRGRQHQGVAAVTQVLGMPVRLGETPGQVRLPAPEFGEHTEEILTGLLDYSWDQIGVLRKGEVI